MRYVLFSAFALSALYFGGLYLHEYSFRRLAPPAFQLGETLITRGTFLGCRFAVFKVTNGAEIERLDLAGSQLIIDRLNNGAMKIRDIERTQHITIRNQAWKVLVFGEKPDFGARERKEPLIFISEEAQKILAYSADAYESAKKDCLSIGIDNHKEVRINDTFRDEVAELVENNNTLISFANFGFHMSIYDVAAEKLYLMAHN